MPERYRYLLDWYGAWSKEAHMGTPELKFEEDPLIRLIGSGREIWAEEHADEYVENLRREHI
jgi:hypothetical protein